MPGTGPVLIVGGNMYLGHLVRELLSTGHRLRRVLDTEPVRPMYDGEDLMCGDLASLPLLVDACQGVEAVVDVSKLDTNRVASESVPRSAETVANIWEAARIAGVKRVVTVLSNGVVGFYRRSAMLDHLSSPRPDSPIGLIGAMTESMASLYAFKYGIRAMCIRMGDCCERPCDERMLSTWLSPGDFERLIWTGLTADYLNEIVYGVSANADRWWDNANARRLGYRPLDNSSRFASDLRGLRSANSIENAFQGGKGAADQFAGDVRRIP